MRVGKNPVVVVAHPDDEVLFASGIILRHWHRQWTVICCSVPRRDPIRAWKFFESCRRLNVRGQLLPVAESEPNEPLTGLELLGMLEPYDFIVSHNEHGEYGHFHHMQVHHYVASVVGTRDFATFGYSKEGLGKEQIALNDFEFRQKTDALHAYDHVLPYGEHDWPKWRALEHRYFEEEGMNPRMETYDVRANQSERNLVAA